MPNEDPANSPSIPLAMIVLYDTVFHTPRIGEVTARRKEGWIVMRTSDPNLNEFEDLPERSRAAWDAMLMRLRDDVCANFAGMVHANPGEYANEVTLFSGSPHATATEGDFFLADEWVSVPPVRSGGAYGQLGAIENGT